MGTGALGLTGHSVMQHAKERVKCFGTENAPIQPHCMEARSVKWRTTPMDLWKLRLMGAGIMINAIVRQSRKKVLILLN